MTDPGGLDRRGRVRPPAQGSELATVSGFLDHQRDTLRWKCEGLDAEQLYRRIEPSGVTLGGLLTHLAWVEYGWFGRVVAGQPAREPWALMSDEEQWTRDDTLTGSFLRRRWQDEVDRSREIVADRAGADPEVLSTSYQVGRRTLSLRWIMVHLIEEYARHNGHADLLRESIDGQVGD